MHMQNFIEMRLFIFQILNKSAFWTWIKGHNYVVSEWNYPTCNSIPLLSDTNVYHAYQSLACETTINTDFSELFSLKCIYVKYKNAILSLIDSFFRIWRDKTYGQVLSQIFNFYGETRSQDRTNQISRKRPAYLSQFFHVQKKQCICDKIAFLYFT